MLIRIRRSKDLLKQFQEFECSSLFAFHYAYTGRLAIIHTAELERNDCFSLPLLRNVVLMEKNIGKKLPNRISDQV